jgi:glycosyltransferase involved in cell wall biosynthesis
VFICVPICVDLCDISKANMKVLMISRDESILEPNSISAGRMAEYGNLCDELHIIVLSGRKSEISPSPRLSRAGGRIPKSEATPTFSPYFAEGETGGVRGGQNPKSKIQSSNNVFVYSTNSFFKILSVFTAYRIAKKIIRNSGFGVRDWVVTVQDPFETGLVGLWLKRKFKIGLNAQLHGDFFGNPYFESESFLNKIRLKMAARVVKNADSIRVVSERIKKSIVSIFNFPESKIVVVPIHTDVQRIQGAPPKFDLHERFSESNLILLWVGRMGKVKNLSFLLRAFKYFLEAFPEAVLVLVGDGPEEATLKEESKRLGIDKSVKFEGRQEDLVSYYKTADIFVFPSLYEGWGRVVVEAAAAGLPVVMTDVGCAGEVIKNEESGEVAPVGDLAAFVRAVTKLGFNLDLRKKYGENALKSIQNLPNKEEMLNLVKKSWGYCQK